jgi:nitroreductase
MDKKTISASVAEVIRSRKTEKVLCDLEAAKPVSPEIARRNREIVLQAIKTAGWAPFHYPRNVAGVAEPWRAHVIWQEEAQRIALHLRDSLQVTTKEPSLAAGCSAMLLVTWLPEFYTVQSQQLPRETQIARDEEHLAASAAMVQNLLLILTSHGMGTYWSSGGKLKGPEMFGFLGIPDNERLLAAVFVEYPEMMDDSKIRVSGKLRDSRSDSWIREVTL